MEADFLQGVAKADHILFVLDDLNILHNIGL